MTACIMVGEAAAAVFLHHRHRSNGKGCRVGDHASISDLSGRMVNAEADRPAPRVRPARENPPTSTRESEGMNGVQSSRLGSVRGSTRRA